MWLKAIIFFTIFSCHYILADEVAEKILDFCSGNGFNFVTFFDWNDGNESEMAQIAFAKNLRARFFESVEDNFGNLDFIVFKDPVDLGQALNVIQRHKIKRSLLVLPETDLEKFLNEVASMEQNSLFYLLTYDVFGNFIWRSVLTINRNPQVVLNKLDFDANGTIIEKYNLQGLEIVATSLTWGPYIYNENCNEKGRGCTNTGWFVDMMNMWANQFNYTWDIYADINNNWGLFPLSGPYNQSGNWTGVLGDVVNGNYPMSLNSWNWIIERDHMLDFVPIIKDREILAVVPSPPKVDPGLFIRPFRDDTWQGIGFIMIIGLVLMFIPFVFVRYYFDTTAFNVVITSGWFFFVLINAYYGGALTMFFVSEISLPFNTIRDALKAFPEWKMIYQDGNDNFFKLPALQGDKDYGNYWNIASQSKEEFTFATVVQGANLLQNSKTVMHVMDGMLRGAYKKESHLFPPNIKSFGAKRPKYFCMLFAKNSPLVPVFERAFLFSAEKGVSEKLQLQWQGSAIPFSAGAEIQILSGGQVFLIFGVLMSILLVAVWFLICELLHHRLKMKTRKSSLKKNIKNNTILVPKHHIDIVTLATKNHSERFA